LLLLQWCNNDDDEVDMPPRSRWIIPLSTVTVDNWVTPSCCGKTSGRRRIGRRDVVFTTKTLGDNNDERIIVEWYDIMMEVAKELRIWKIWSREKNNMMDRESAISITVWLASSSKNNAPCWKGLFRPPQNSRNFASFLSLSLCFVRFVRWWLSPNRPSRSVDLHFAADGINQTPPLRCIISWRPVQLIST
jgi:hypothetical protein